MTSMASSNCLASTGTRVMAAAAAAVAARRRRRHRHPHRPLVPPSRRGSAVRQPRTRKRRKKKEERIVGFKRGGVGRPRFLIFLYLASSFADTGPKWKTTKRRGPPFRRLVFSFVPLSRAAASPVRWSPNPAPSWLPKPTDLRRCPPPPILGMSPAGGKENKEHKGPDEPRFPVRAVSVSSRPSREEGGAQAARKTPAPPPPLGSRLRSRATSPFRRANWGTMPASHARPSLHGGYPWPRSARLAPPHENTTRRHDGNDDDGGAPGGPVGPALA